MSSERRVCKETEGCCWWWWWGGGVLGATVAETNCGRNKLNWTNLARLYPGQMAQLQEVCAHGVSSEAWFFFFFMFCEKWWRWRIGLVWRAGWCQGRLFPRRLRHRYICSLKACSPSSHRRRRRLCHGTAQEWWGGLLLGCPPLGAADRLARLT